MNSRSCRITGILAGSLLDTVSALFDGPNSSGSARKLGALHDITKAARKAATQTAVQVIVSSMVAQKIKKMLNATNNGTLPHPGNLTDVVKNIVAPIECRKPCLWVRELKACLNPDGTQC